MRLLRPALRGAAISTQSWQPNPAPSTIFETSTEDLSQTPLPYDTRSRSSERTLTDTHSLA